MLIGIINLIHSKIKIIDVIVNVHHLYQYKLHVLQYSILTYSIFTSIKL